MEEIYGACCQVLGKSVKSKVLTAATWEKHTIKIARQSNANISSLLGALGA